jgi:TRAP-type transport system periplasmic protein
MIARRNFMVAIAAAPLGFSVLCTAAKAAQFEFRISSDQPAQHPTVVHGREMWMAIERESGGRIHAQFFANNELGGQQSQLSQLRLGALNFIMGGAAVLPAISPATDILSLGFAFKNEDEALRVSDGPLGEYLRKEVVAKGVYPLRRIWNSGMRQITANSHPIRTPEDVNGFKIRVVESKISVDLFKLLGGSPTPLGISELYMALQTKIVDGEEAPLTTIETGRYYEVQKFLSVTNHSWSCTWALANSDTWKSIPSDLQDVIERNNAKYALIARRETIAFNAATATKLAGQGLATNVVDGTPFRAHLGPYYASWQSAFGSTAWSLLQNSISSKLGTA